MDWCFLFQKFAGWWKETDSPDLLGRDLQLWWQQWWSTSLKRSWKSRETLLMSLERRELSQDTSCWPLITTMSSLKLLEIASSMNQVSFLILNQSFLWRKKETKKDLRILNKFPVPKKFENYCYFIIKRSFIAKN